MSNCRSLPFLRKNGDDIYSLSSVRSQRVSPGSIYSLRLDSKSTKEVREEEEADTPVWQEEESPGEMATYRQDTSFWFNKFNGGFNHHQQASHIPSNSEIGAEYVVEIGEWDSDINVSNTSSYASMVQNSSRSSYETQKTLGVSSNNPSSDHVMQMGLSTSYGVEEDRLTEPTTLLENELENNKHERDNINESASSDEEFTLMLKEKHNTLNSKSSASQQVCYEC